MDNSNDIAVIGLACRFPGEATTAGKFWELLSKGESTYSESHSRFNESAFQSGSNGSPARSRAKGGHYLKEDIAAFDLNFFSIKTSEALAMDPQQRLMLEIAYEAFENAGLPLATLAGTQTSCYIGCFTNDYREMQLRDPESAPLYTLSGSGPEMISNRISWFFDLKGPSMTLNTACSSSLVALHQGCQSLRSKESSMSIIGGVNLLLSPDMFLLLSNQQFLAPDGRCKSFDERGDGYGRGEGGAAVILKRIDDAIRDGDPIRAVIRGSGVNQDGRTQGITVPNGRAQADLIRSTYRFAGLDMKDTGYFETHGTGTRVGDPIELEAIGRTLGSVRQSDNPLIIGSVKSNIGHLEAAAGLAGLIKGIYVLEHGLIPPNFDFQHPNPAIPFANWNIRVPEMIEAWPDGTPRRISVQCFGYCGTNVHVILDNTRQYLKERQHLVNHVCELSESVCLADTQILKLQYPVSKSCGKEDKYSTTILNRLRLYLFSASDQAGVHRQKAAFLEYLQAAPSGIQKDSLSADHYLHNLAFTLSEKRSRLRWKHCLVASSLDMLMRGLQSETSDSLPHRASGSPRIGFIFTGQGAQYARMGYELNQYQTFRDSVEIADKYLRSALGCPWSAVEELRREEAQSRINDVEYGQPLCTILQMALVDLLFSWNILPSTMVGHSSGEIVAAYCRGVLSKEDALKVAYYRGLLYSRMQTGSSSLQGAMMAVGLSESQALDWIDRVTGDSVVIACVNSPSSVTLSGDTTGIRKLYDILRLEGVFVRKLKVDGAYHSPHMEAMSVPYFEAIKDIQISGGHDLRTMFSAVTGKIADPLELGPRNWVRNLVSPVLFYDALLSLLNPSQSHPSVGKADVDILLEIGPHSTLKGPVVQVLERHGIQKVHYLPMLTRGQNPVQTALSTAAVLLSRGVGVDVAKVNDYAEDNLKHRVIPFTNLPSYSWDHSRTFWAESRISRGYRFRNHPQRSLIGAPYPKLSAKELIWRGFQRISAQPWIEHHKIGGSIMYPAAGYIAMVVEGARQIATKGRPIRSFSLRQIHLVAPAIITEESDLEYTLHFKPYDRVSTSEWFDFSVSTSLDGQDLQLNCSGMLLIEYTPAVGTGMSLELNFEYQKYRDQYCRNRRLCQSSENIKGFYEDLAASGLNYGSSFQRISQIRTDDRLSCYVVDIGDCSLLNDDMSKNRPHTIHPTVLDAMFQSAFAAYKHPGRNLKTAMVPKSIEEVVVSASIPYEAGTQFKGYSNASKQGFRDLLATAVMLDEHLNEPMVIIKGLLCTSIVGTTENADAGPSFKNIFTKLRWEPFQALPSADQEHELKSSSAEKPTSLNRSTTPPSINGYAKIVIVEAPNASQKTESFTTRLVSELHERHVQARRLVWDKDDFLDEAPFISLLELEKPFLLNLNAVDFKKLQSLILRSSRLLWVSSISGPSCALVTGLARTIRNEVPGKNFRTLLLDSELISTYHSTMLVAQLAISLTPDTEFVEQNGVLKISRLEEDEELQKELTSWVCQRASTSRPSLRDCVRSHSKLAIREQGMLDTLFLEAESIPESDLNDEEVEIEVRATGLNFRDVMVTMGQMPDNLLGFEASGVVSRVGRAVAQLAVGDKVSTIGHGAHRGVFCNNARLCQRMPHDLSFEEAAGLPLVFSTAFYALVHVARAKRGQTILIHAAAGGVGQAAIQIAQHLGLEIYATAGTADKRLLIQQTYHISEDHIFDSRDLSFAKGVLRMTNGRGVDCVLNSLSGEALRQSWTCVAPFGTFVEIGMTDILSNSGLDMRLFGRNITFTFFNLKDIMTENLELMEEILKATFDLLRRGIIKPILPLTVYPIKEVESAFRLMQTGKHRGKIVLTWEKKDTLSMLPHATNALQLDENATYLLVGGLGGLGRSLANLLVGLGARHLAFISRSGANSEAKKLLMSDLKRQNVQASVYLCDIANKEQLAAVLSHISHDQPKIKGILQCAMVLQDTSFEKMTYHQWTQSLGPKVHGSWNLHELLPQDVEFSITLSSFAGIFGNRSQSNYSAGCAYQDALAYYRRSKNLKAVTVDLGIMRDVGVIAEQGATSYLKEWEEPFGLRESEFHAIIEKTIASELTEKLENTRPHIITGFATGGAALAAGIQRPFYFDDPRFSLLEQSGINGKQLSLSEINLLRDQLARAITLADAVAAVKGTLVSRVAKSMQTAMVEIDESRPLHSYGVDSLVAIEIGNWVFKETKVTLSIFDLLANVPITSLAQKIAMKSPYLPAALVSAQESLSAADSKVLIS